MNFRDGQNCASRGAPWGLGRGEPTYNMSACFAAWMSKPQMWTVPTGQATPTWRCGRYGLGD